MTQEELIEKGYVYMSYRKAYSLKTDIAVLSIPRQIVCEDKLTYNMMLKKLTSCHIGTSSTFETLTITS